MRDRARVQRIVLAARIWPKNAVTGLTWVSGLLQYCTLGLSHVGSRICSFSSSPRNHCVHINHVDPFVPTTPVLAGSETCNARTFAPCSSRSRTVVEYLCSCAIVHLKHNALQICPGPVAVDQCRPTPRVSMFLGHSHTGLTYASFVQHLATSAPAHVWTSCPGPHQRCRKVRFCQQQRAVPPPRVMSVG